MTKKKEQAVTSPDETRFGKIHRERQAKRGCRKITVEEWSEEGKPFEIYAYPLTMNDVIALEKYPTPAEQNVMQIIRQSMDARGEPMFSLLDKAGLLNEPADVIGSILIKLNGAASSFDQELKKNNE